MWDTPFDESMLSVQPGVAIYCEDDQAAEELFEIFKRNDLGKHWIAGVYGERAYCVSKVMDCNGEPNLLLRGHIRIAIL